MDELSERCAKLANGLAARMAHTPAPIRLLDADTGTREHPLAGDGTPFIGRRYVLCATLLNPAISEIAVKIERIVGES